MFAQKYAVKKRNVWAVNGLIANRRHTIVFCCHSLIAVKIIFCLSFHALLKSNKHEIMRLHWNDKCHEIMENILRRSNSIFISICQPPRFMSRRWCIKCLFAKTESKPFFASFNRMRDGKFQQNSQWNYMIATIEYFCYKWITRQPMENLC